VPLPPAMAGRSALLAAVAAAIEGRWDDAHARVQRLEDDRFACWIHAVLHRIEGDQANARYWYRRAGHEPPAAALAPREELAQIRALLEGS